MCQRVLISKNIHSICVRSFERNLEAASGVEVSTLKLGRLNRSLDSLYELLYSQFNDIDSEDYKILGPQLSMLLSTVKSLYLTYKNIAYSSNNKMAVDELMWNYSALYELKEDLEKYRLRNSVTQDLSKAMGIASSYIDKI